MVYQVRQEDRFHSLLPSQSRSVSSGLTWRDIVAPREGMECWRSSCSLLLLATFVTSYSSLAQESFPGGNFRFLLCHSKFPTFSKAWGIVLAPFGMRTSRQSHVVSTVGWVGAKFFKGERKINVGSLQLVEDRGSE